MVQRKVTGKLGVPERPFLHQESAKNGGMDLKKKMKKSGSIKRPDTDALRTANFRQHVKQPGKPPTETPSVPVAITTPNYMRGTSSSDARKEKGQVSAKSAQTSPDSSRLRRKSLGSEKLGVAADKKAKSSARMTTLKLTSTPSFKPVRVSAKKCSPVALSEDLDVQRATCSSTLKDCKFPTYLTLSPGGTELEGTSAVKVCPYTYCSLNGHRHAALPPLKTFLSGKRRAIKAQRSFKLGCLSPRRARAANQLDLSGPIVSPGTQEEMNDFFVEIYAPKEDDTAMELPLVEGGDEKGAKNHETQKDPEDRAELGGLGDIMEQSSEAAQVLETDSEVSDTEWETGHGSAVYLDDDDQYFSETEKESDPEGGKIQSCLAEDEALIQSDEFPAYEVSQETIDEEGFGSDSGFSCDDSESADSCDYLEGLEAASEHMHDPSLEGNQSSETNLPIDNLGEEELLATITSDDVPDQTSADDEFKIHITENQDNLETDCNQDGNLHTTSLTHHAKESRAANPGTEGNSLTIVIGKGKNLNQDPDELGQFNPRDPNFLPLQPEPEAENVALRHQELDERKNTDEWMVDFALRQVVTKLGPARKRKVALLVEAFERVIPTTKYEFHQTHSSVFESPRPMQACI